MVFYSLHYDGCWFGTVHNDMFIWGRATVQEVRRWLLKPEPPLQSLGLYFGASCLPSLLAGYRVRRLAITIFVPALNEHVYQ
jgi:hypothetical protein